MTTEEIKKQLRDVSFRESQIAEMEEEIERVLSIATGGAVSYDSDRIQKSPRADGLESKVIELVEIKEKVIELYIKNINEKLHIMEQLFAMSDERYRQVLYRHYIKGERLTTIANEMGYSYERCRHLNSEALRAAVESWL